MQNSKYFFLILVATLTANMYAVTFSCPDGSTYSGDIENSLFNGYGEQQWPNGDYYKGNYKDGQFHGKGILKNGPYLYEGDFSEGCYNGNGILTSDFGYKYIGSFKDNLFDGRGYLVYSTRESWKGEFIKGELDGTCIHTFANGKKEELFYEDGMIIDVYKPLKILLKVICILAFIISLAFNIIQYKLLKRHNT